MDQIPMLQDDDSVRSVEMGAFNGAEDFSLKINDDDDINQMYGNTGASAAVSENALSGDLGKHEHLLRSGPMGKCSDPFCQTCPSYFGYSDQVAPPVSSLTPLILDSFCIVEHRGRELCDMGECVA